MEELEDGDLHTAARYEDVDAVLAALDRGTCDVNKIGLYRWSPLHEAASNGSAHIVRLLLQHGADPNLKDALTQSTAVHYASREGHIECLQLLLDSGGSYDLEDVNGDTALDLASPSSKQVLECHRVKELTNMSLDEARANVMRISLPKLDQARGHVQQTRCSSSESMEQSSATSDSSDTSPPVPHAAWLLEQPSQSGPSIGLLHASFEYHSKKHYLKIRAWKLTSMKLTHENSSSIGTIFVKCRLEPEAGQMKKTKRKTEEVKVEPLTGKEPPAAAAARQAPRRCYPSSFSFSRPLEYFDITDDAVDKKTLHIQVCVSHKFTRKSYAVGDLAMPLKAATKKLLKDAYPVRPSPYSDAPNGTRVLISSGEADVAGNSKSDTDLRPRSTLGRLLLLDRQSTYRASSDTQLRDVVSTFSSADSGSSVSIDMPENHDRVEPVDIITAVDNDQQTTPKSKSTTVSISEGVNQNVIAHEGKWNTATFELEEVKSGIHGELRSHRVQVPTMARNAGETADTSRIQSSQRRIITNACTVNIPGEFVEIPMENLDIESFR